MQSKDKKKADKSDVNEEVGENESQVSTLFTIVFVIGYGASVFGSIYLSVFL